MQDFPSPSRAPWLSAYEGMISWRGVAKKRRAQDLAGMTVKSSVSVATKQQSWRGGNHFCLPAASRCRRRSRRRRQTRTSKGGPRQGGTMPWSDGQVWPSPCIAHDALAGVAAGDLGELALEGGSGRPAVQPF